MRSEEAIKKEIKRLQGYHSHYVAVARDAIRYSLDQSCKDVEIANVRATSEKIDLLEWVLGGDK